MDFYVDLYIFINCFCTALLLVIALHSRIGMGDTVSRRYFAAVIYTSVVFFLSDTLWFAMNYHILPQVWWIGTLLNNVYFLSVTFAGYLWCLFLLALANASIVTSKRNRRIIFIPVLIHIALCVYNLFDPILFGIDQNFTYFRGPLMLVQYAFYYLYTISVSVYAFIKAFRPQNYIERGHYLLVATFPLFPVTSAALEFFYPHLPFNCMAFTLILTIVYVNELGQQISQEPLTHLANRKQLMKAFEQGVPQHGDENKLYLFMMDLDGFKAINDTYGHYEGDRSLIMVSKALKKAVSGLHQRATLARYAGDEFAIIAYFSDPADAQKLKESIQHEVEVQNGQIELGYKLCMSIGVAQLTPQMNGFRDLLEAADADLYQQKRRD